MSNGCFALRLDEDTTLLSSAAGGEIFAPVLEDAGTVPYIKKRPGPVQYKDITVEVGFAMSDVLFDWIAAAWAGKDQPKDGALLAATAYDLTIKAERQFKSARIAATIVPALDATSKGAPPLSVRLTPGSLALMPGAGKLQLKAVKQYLWRASNFKLEIDGLECNKVSRIDSFTVPAAVNGKVAFPTLVITLAANSAATWNSWFQDFLIAGHSDDQAEKTGKITFLLPDLKTPLARIELRGLGIVGLETMPVGPNQIAKLTASLYCEQMSLHRDKP